MIIERKSVDCQKTDLFKDKIILKQIHILKSIFKDGIALSTEDHIEAEHLSISQF